MTGKYTLQYASNLFLNLQNKLVFSDILKKCSPHLALLGNICSLDTDRSRTIYKEFLTYVSYNWEQTFLVPGPYELCSVKPQHYKEMIDNLDELKEDFSNVIILNNSHTTVPNTDIQIIGSTLWCRKPYLKQQSMFEYSYIWLDRHQGLGQIMGNDIVSWHEEDVEFIENMINTYERSIILTHHLPHTILTDDILRNRMESSNLEHMLQKPINIWLGGAGNKTISGNLGICSDVHCSTNPYTTFNTARNAYSSSYNNKQYVSLRTEEIELV